MEVECFAFVATTTIDRALPVQSKPPHNSTPLRPAQNLASESRIMTPDDRPGGATKRGGVWVPGMAGIMDRPYSLERGFCVFCDYLHLHLGGLPGLSRLDLPGQSWSKVCDPLRKLYRDYIYIEREKCFCLKATFFLGGGGVEGRGRRGHSKFALALIFFLCVRHKNYRF